MYGFDTLRVYAPYVLYETDRIEREELRKESERARTVRLVRGYRRLERKQ
jgi:hypothetical protein